MGKAEKMKVLRIKQVVCEYYAVMMLDLDGNRRLSQIVRPRSVAMFLSSRLTDNSDYALGRMFGGKDHSCVVKARKRIERELLDDLKLKAEIGELRSILIDGKWQKKDAA